MTPRRAVAAAPDATFDAAWMTRTFEAFWADQGAVTVRFNNLLLEPLTAAGRLLMISQYGSDGRGDSPARGSPTRSPRTSAIRACTPRRSSTSAPPAR